eukprot:TRINITY_DN58023_c0_g1_i1.p1 TRINITY_DN58023_c0_g1~~TRINITY_DN58023_c0_g1_i1.p1  ORF type:complete len:305 (+),score=43.14 TRINITY_DN58023_c0_g1_i1:166-1080(+)
MAIRTWILIASLFLATATPWTLFPSGEVPGERPDTVGPEVFGECPWDAGKAKCYRNVSVPTLTMYHVAGSTSAIIVAPGGGYTALSWDNEGTSVAEWLNSIGITAFLLKYRVPERPWLNDGQPGGVGGAQFMDAQRAIRLVRSKASSLGFNASKIGFMGFSAGGHLAAHVSNSFSDLAYPRIDDADDVSARPDFVVMGYPWVIKRNQRAIMFKIVPDHPPAFIVQTADDTICPVQNSLLYYLALQQAGAPPSELHEFPVGRHGFGVCKFKPVRDKLEVCSWTSLAEAFLDKLGVVTKRLDHHYV